MRVGVSWLRELVELPADVTASDVERALVDLGIEVESVTDLAATVTGPLVVGRVLEIEELTGFKKPIRYTQVDVGETESRGIVCGARNFAVGIAGGIGIAETCGRKRLETEMLQIACAADVPRIRQHEATRLVQLFELAPLLRERVHQ